MLKIIITDDHKIFRQGLKTLITKEGIAEVIGEAGNGKELLDLLKSKKPDMVLMDIEMPEMNGIEATRKAIEMHPDLKILILSNFGDEASYYQIIQAGARGFTLKTSGIQELQTAIASVSSGESYFSNELLRSIVANVNNKKAEEKNSKFTKREFEVLQLIANGLSNEEIAEKLFLSVTTIKGHRNNLLVKSGSKNTAGLIMYGIKNKIITI